MSHTREESVDDDYSYDAVVIDDDFHEDPNASAELADEDENFESLLRSVQAQKDRDAPPQVRPDLTRLPEVVDDFVRNFFVKHNLLRTLDMFEVEWYERYGQNPEDEVQCVPDVYLENTQLIDRLQKLEDELGKHRAISTKATSLWEQVKKERDFHRMNHSRVIQEKTKISRDLKRLQTHSAVIEPTVTEMRHKYEVVQKEKMLLRLERDKLASRIVSLEETVRELEVASKEGGGGAGSKKSPASAAAASASGGGAAAAAAAAAAPPAPTVKWPQDVRPNPLLNTTSLKAPSNASSWSCRTSFKAHAMAVTRCALHPKKPVVATSSDDGTWRLMSLPQGELIMSGEGHKDWVAGIAMHPKGTMVATASGDKTVKLWDFGTNSCKGTLKAHTEGAWCVDFQETGDLLASGSLDQSARVWDVETMKCKQTLRGHVDSVNAVTWQPYTNILCTGSGDKTVSLWDCRANFCVQTFYGHHNAVTSVAMYHKGDMIASSDAEGAVIVWDVRMIEQKMAYACGPHPANSVSFDKSGTLLAVASDDTTVKLINLLDDKISILRGHEDAVQCAVFDPLTNGFLVSCGSDATVRYWS